MYLLCVIQEQEVKQCVNGLKAQGYQHCVNVLGGIDAWAALIDRNIRRY